MRLPRWFAVCGCLALGQTAVAQDVPAIVAMTVDTSGSIRPELLDQIKQLATQVLESLPSGSQVAVFGFNDQSSLVLERTSDAEAVQQAVQGLQRAGRYTALYDALYDASRYLKEAPPARKAILLVTDGKDENSAVQIDDGLRVAVENHIPVIAIGVGRVEEQVMRRIAKLTVGEYAPIGEASGEAIATRVASLPAPAPEAPPAAPVASSGGGSAGLAPPPAAGRASWLWPAVLGVVAIAGIGAFFVLRQRRAGAESESALHGVPSGDGDADSTVVMRNPDAGFVEKTVMLRVKPTLTVTKGVDLNQVYDLSPESAISIGRAPTNDIPVNDVAVSGEHCRIRPEGAMFVLHDLESTNGTFVNEKRITRQALNEGDVIRVGETHLTFKTS
jgi:hypothetical protein